MQPHYSQPSRNNPMSLKNKLTKQNATIQQVLISKFALKTRKFTGPTEKQTPEWLFRYPAF